MIYTCKIPNIIKKAFRKTQAIVKTYKRILIAQTAFLGDLVLTTPLIRAVRQLFPDSMIDGLFTPQTVDLIRHNPNLSHIYTFDKRRNKKKAFAETLPVLKRQHYDLAISLHRYLSTLLLLFCSDIPRRIGFQSGWPGILLTDRVEYRRDLSEIERNLSLLSPLTRQTFDIQTEITLDPESENEAISMLSTVPFHHFRIAIAPGSVWPTKRWTEDHYVHVLSRFADQPVSFIFIGSSEEQELCQRIIHRSGVKQALNTAGSTSLLQAAALIKHCHLFIGNDSAPLHLANAVKTDVMAFFGPTDRSLGFFPFRPNDNVFQVDLDCRPCSRHGSKRCPQRHFNCMKTLQPEPVVSEIRQRIKEFVPAE